MTSTATTATEATLYDYDTSDAIRPATADELAASVAAAERDGGAGVILVDADGDVVADGSWEARQPGTRTCYVL